jgi:hypothetical protein
MARISTYGIDPNITANDKWIGTDFNTQYTKNFTPQYLADFFNISNSIGVSGQMSFKYYSTFPSGRPEESITTPAVNPNFSAVTSFKIHKNSGGGNYCIDFINYLSGDEILISDTSNSDIFGHFKLNSVTQDLSETNFYNLNVTYIGGNGNLQHLNVYSIALYSATVSIPTVGTWGALNYPTWTTGTPFVKMTAAGTFALDTNTYLTQDNVVEYTNLAAFPVTGVIGTIYIALDTGFFYSWNGTTYIPSSAPNTGITGIGLANYVGRWTSPTTMGTGVIRDDGSNVGINTSPNASYRLSVNGNANISNFLYANVLQLSNAIIYTGGGNLGSITRGGRNVDYFASGNISSHGNITFSDGDRLTSGTETARFDTYDRRLGIRTTTPTEALDVNGNVRNRGFYYDETNSAGTAGKILSATSTGTQWINSPTIPTTPNLQQVTDIGNTTSNVIEVAGITSGNFNSDGYGVYISDSSDGINNFQYIPYAGLFVGNGTDIYTNVMHDASILFQNSGGYGNLRSDLLTGFRTWQLPNASGTIALTSNIGTWGALNYPTWTTGMPFVKMTAAGTFALDTTSYYPYPTGTISQYIRGDGTLATFPSVATPTLQQVTTAGNTTTDAIYLQSGLSPNSVILSNGYISLFNNITNRQISISTSNDIAFSDVGGSSLYLKAPATITATNTQTLQNASGTIALLSDITTPTLQEVLDNNHDLVDSINLQGTFAGSFNTGTHINAFGYEAGKNNSGSNCNFIGQYSGINNSGERVIALGISSGFANTYNDVYLFGSGASATENGQLVFANSGNNARLSTSLLNSSRQYNLPNASGTIALVSDIPTTSGIPHATASGTDTYTATVSGVTAYNDADAYLIRFTNGNTTSATLNINSLGAIPLYRNNDGVLIGGDIIDDGEMLCVYNSTTNRFQVIGTAPNSLFAYVTNDDSVTLTKGMPVYAFGGTGDRMTVKRANNSADATSAQTVGLVLSTSIAANQKGLIMMQGLLDGLSILPTSTFADGDPVYLGATAGSITNIKPHAPNHLVYLGFVTTASPGSAGRMYVRVQNGYELDELHNVQAQTPSLKDTLWYDNTVSPSQWKTASIPTILGYTPPNLGLVQAMTQGLQNIF